MKDKYPNHTYRTIILAVSLLLLLAGCSYPHLYYSPNMYTVPLFKEPSEFSGVVAGSFGAVNPSFELQTAFSLPAHIGLGFNFMTGGTDNSSEDYDDLSKYHYFEGFGGYYTCFKKIGIFELYAGYGEGSEHHTFAYKEYDGWFSWTWTEDGTADMNFSRIFIQPNIGLRIKAIEGAFSFRLSRLNFKEINYANTVYRLTELQNLESEPASWLLEPGFTFRGGPDPVKFQVQAVLSANPSNPDLSFENFRFNIGMNIKFGMKKKVNPEAAKNP